MKYLKTFILFVLVSSCLGLLGQEEIRPQYASGKNKKHRNKIDELGQKQGSWKYFNASGLLMSETEYLNNQKHGVSRTYYPYEKIMEEIEYQYGVKEGDYKKYFYSGQVAIEGEYSAGKKENKWTKYFSDGSVAWEGTYKRGLRDGDWKYYDRKGNVVSTISYKNGVDMAVQKMADDKKKAADDKKKKVLPGGKGAPVDSLKAKAIPPSGMPTPAPVDTSIKK